MAREIATLAALDPVLRPVGEMLQSARAQVEDAAASLSHYAGKLRFDPERVSAIIRQYGTEKMIMETFDDPSWVHQFLRILDGGGTPKEIGGDILLFSTRKGKDQTTNTLTRSDGT